MKLVFTYFVTLIIIVLSVVITLFFKTELERMFKEKHEVLPFHICNVLIILMASLGAHATMSIYVMDVSFHLFLQIIIHLIMIMPIYLLGQRAFDKYRSIYRKYTVTEDEKVIVLNEKYLKKKKRFPKLEQYNAAAKEK